jgi:signal transduction histidine kinase
VTTGEPGARSAASLRVSLSKIRQLMERIQLGETRGLLGYIESMAQDLAEDQPEIDLSIDIPSPFPALDALPALHTLLTLSAIELIDNAKDALAGQGQIKV